VLRGARPPQPAPIVIVGEPRDYLAAALDELERPLEGLGAQAAAPAGAAARLLQEPAGGAGAGDDAAPLHAPGDAPIRDRRGGGIAGTIAALVAAGERVLVVAADAHVRARHLAPILGGFELCSHTALDRDPGLVAAGAHVVMLDPPPGPARGYGAMTHLVWGPAEMQFAAQVHDARHDLRPALAASYRALRDAGGARGKQLETLLRGDVATPRPAWLAGRLVRVLAELGLVRLDVEARSLQVPPAERTELEQSAAFRAYHQAYEDGRRWLSAQRAKAA